MRSTLSVIIVKKEIFMLSGDIEGPEIGLSVSKEPREYLEVSPSSCLEQAISLSGVISLNALLGNCFFQTLKL